MDILSSSIVTPVHHLLTSIDLSHAPIQLSICIVIAIFFTFVPILPGSFFIVIGAIWYGSTNSFDAFTLQFWIGQSLLIVGYMFIDNLAQLLGIEYCGGSKSAKWGATLGVMFGPIFCAPVFGPFALIVGPPAGAMAGALIGEYQHRSANKEELDIFSAIKLSIGATLSYIAGTAAKLVILAVQIYWLLHVVL